MNPTSPALRRDVIYAKHQPEYLPLPATVVGDTTISRWRLSWRERLRVLWTGHIWLQQMNFGRPPQPQLPTTKAPTA